MPLAPGTRLGPYEIAAPLGAGGMGEVYRARDPRLGREVAIKVLAPSLVATPEGRARFEREARTISQLQHPNICTVFDVGHQDGTDFLVLELIEGETLAQRLDRGPLPLAETLALGRQIAEALDRAHTAGVVHRDLKPGNIMLTRGGAKLMDFGLARATGLAAAPLSSASIGQTLTHSPTVAAPLTAEGTIVGTFQYMAPEQLEGKEADARSDLWAFGCLLYEMATGVRAFSGESQASLIAAIMTGEPRPVTELQPVTPPELERVVQRCLRKRPDDRLQSARDAAFVLELVASRGGHAADAAPVIAPARRRGVPIAVAAVAAAVLAATGFLAGRISAPPGGQGAIRVSPLSQGTRDGEPAVSPDGRLVSFSAIRQNGQGVWLMDMITRSEVKLTAEVDQLPRFTADGGSVLFTRTREGRQSIWRIPVIGGVPRLVLEQAADADPSPDGHRIAFVTGQSDSSGVRARLMVARADGTEPRELWSKSSVVLASPRWSPDGRQVAITVSGSQNTPNQVCVIDAGSGRAREYAAPHLAVLSCPVWIPGGGIIVAEGAGITAIQSGAAGHLYRLDPGSGHWNPLGWLENFPVIFDRLPDGRLVLSSQRVRESLREIAIDSRDLYGARVLTSGTAIDRQPVYSPDGRSVMFSSNRGGTLDLWEVSVDSGEMHRVTDDPADDWDPAYTPDGQSILWCSSRSGAFEIWTARRDGSAPRQLSRDSLDAENPSASPDQQWVIYSSSHPVKSGLWRVPMSGGAGERLLASSTLIPDLSPDGRYASVIHGVGTLEPDLGVFDLHEKRLLSRPVPFQARVGGVQIGRSRFSRDGRSVTYVGTRAKGDPVLLRRPLSAWMTGEGKVDTLFAAGNETIESFGISPDGKRAVVSVVDWLSGLTIAESVEGVAARKNAR